MLLEHGCLDLMCQPQKLLTFWTSEPQVAYKMVAYIKKKCILFRSWCIIIIPKIIQNGQAVPEIFKFENCSMTSLTIHDVPQDTTGT